MPGIQEYALVCIEVQLTFFSGKKLSIQIGRENSSSTSQRTRNAHASPRSSTPGLLIAKTNGFDSIEFDNLDTYTSFSTLSINGNLAYAKLLVDHAHSLSLAAGQKNTVEVAERAKTEIGFDFAVAEECQEWDECDGYTDVYGRLVLEIEYNRQAFEDACDARATEASVIFRDVDVVPRGEDRYEYATC